MSFDALLKNFSDECERIRNANFNKKIENSKRTKEHRSCGEANTIEDLSVITENNNSELKKSKEIVMSRSRIDLSNDVNNAPTPNAWQKFRPQGAMNFSELFEDCTIDARSTTPSMNYGDSSKQIFAPEEITGRSTCLQENERLRDTNNEARDISVNMILGDSFVEEIRSLSKIPSKINGSSNHLPLAIGSDISEPSVNTSWKSIYKTAENQDTNAGDSIRSDEFVPYDLAQDKINNDEREWQNEFGNLPADSESIVSSEQSTPGIRIPKDKLINLTEFSGYLAENNPADFSEMSLGNFFSKRSEDLHHIIPNRSPTKRQKPIALIPQSDCSATTGYNTSADYCKISQASTSLYTDDELKKKSLPRVYNATYDKQSRASSKNSVLSVSSIAMKLGDDVQESPVTIVNQMTNALRSRSMKSLSSISQGSTKSSVGSVNSNLFKKFSSLEDDRMNIIGPSAFAKTNQSIGMLARMNSTVIEDKDKEDEKMMWRNTGAPDNDGACESTLDITDFHTDLSSTGYDYETSSREDQRRIKTKSPKRIAVPSKTANSKRMRSPISLNVEPYVNVHVPHNEFQHIQHESPDKSWHEENSENMSPKNTAASKHLNELSRQFTARSPMDGSKYSLPNYGLKNSNKCALSPNAISVGRSSSQCSTNSEFSQNDGKFPLKANKFVLSWDCIKLRKSIVKSFVVKNVSHKRITLSVEVNGPGFQVTSSNQDNGSLVLQGNECRTINAVFCPTVIGKAIGKVVFKPLKGWPDHVQRRVYLCGYGGNTSLQLQGIERGPVGTPFLKLGETSEIHSTTLHRSFTVYNKGPLHGMATITVKPKTSQYINDSHVMIEPNKCVIDPDSSAQINVTYKLRRKDVEKLSQKSCDVLTVTSLEVIIGADPNRQRIASILTRAKSVPPSYAPLNFLVNGFPSPKEKFKDFNETIDDVADLFSSFKTIEIALTINRTALDETRDTCIEGIEDSVFFRTMVADTPENQLRHAHQIETHFEPISEEEWHVTPKQLFMDELNNNRKTIVIHNNFKKAQTFEINSNLPHLFTFSTNADRIPSRGEYSVELFLKPGICTSYNAIIYVYIETDSIEVPICIKPVPWHLRKNN